MADKDIQLSAEEKRRLSMISEANRLASFKKWVFDNDQTCNAAMMAKAGFFSVATKEDPDSTQCFLCGKTLDGWEADDDPFKEHLSHAKFCAFAKLQLPEESLTIKQYSDMMMEQHMNVLAKHYDVMINERNEMWDEIIQNLEERYDDCK